MLNLFNYGTNIQAWVETFSLIAVGVFIVWFSRSVYVFFKAWSSGKHIKPYAMITRGLFLLCVIVFLYFGYGSPPPRMPPAETGMFDLIDQAEDEKSVEELKTKAESERDPLLKAQERDSKLEQIESENFVKEALKRAGEDK